MLMGFNQVQFHIELHKRANGMKIFSTPRIEGIHLVKGQGFFFHLWYVFEIAGKLKKCLCACVYDCLTGRVCVRFRNRDLRGAEVGNMNVHFPTGIVTALI